MGNNGNSNDKKFITEAIYGGKLLRINKNEPCVTRIIKEKINFLIINDRVTTIKHNGKKYDTHSAYYGMYKLLIKINRLRLKNWFWDKLV